MSCCVVNQHCTHPANWTPVRTPRSSCWSCGEPVCTSLGCSITTTTWPAAKGQKVRICASCVEDRGTDRLKARVDADIYRGAQYPETARLILRGEFTPHWRKVA